MAENADALRRYREWQRANEALTVYSSPNTDAQLLPLIDGPLAGEVRRVAGFPFAGARIQFSGMGGRKYVYNADGTFAYEVAEPNREPRDGRTDDLMAGW